MTTLFLWPVSLFELIFKFYFKASILDTLSSTPVSDKGFSLEIDLIFALLADLSNVETKVFEVDRILLLLLVKVDFGLFGMLL